jgi:hypothetical protein
VERITLADIKKLPEYEAMRDAMRTHVIGLKRLRRVSLGDRITLLFENRETALYQIHEMMRAERITAPDAIQAEIDVYGRSVPEGNELSATMFIEITEQDAIRLLLDRLIGVNERLRLRIGEGHVIPGVFEPGWSREDRIAAVQYVKFPFSPEQADAFKSGREPVFIEVDHPNYQASTRIEGEVRQELARDLE